MSIWHKPADTWKVVNTSGSLPSRGWVKVGDEWNELEALYHNIGGAIDVWSKVYVPPASFNRISSLNIVVGSSGTTLTWVPPSSPNTALLRVVRKKGSPPANRDDGEVAQNLPADAPGLIDPDITIYSPLDTYYWAVYSQDVDTTWYDPVIGSKTLNDATPPGLVSITRNKAIKGRAYVNWTEPSDSDYSHVMVRYSSSGYPSATSGTLVGNFYKGTTGFSIAGPGSTTTFDGVTVRSRPSSSYYYFSLFSKDLRGNTSAARQTSVYFLKSPVNTVKVAMDSYGSTAWESVANRMRQSNYYEGYDEYKSHPGNNYTGYYFYGSSAAFRSIGSRSIYGGWVRMDRQTSSNGFPDPCTMHPYTHNSDTKPSGFPGRRASYANCTGPGYTVNNPMWMRLPTTMVSDLCRSIGRGVCFYWDTNRATYVSKGSSIEGELKVYHNDYAS